MMNSASLLSTLPLDLIDVMRLAHAANEAQSRAQKTKDVLVNAHSGPWSGRRVTPPAPSDWIVDHNDVSLSAEFVHKTKKVLCSERVGDSGNHAFWETMTVHYLAGYYAALRAYPNDLTVDTPSIFKAAHSGHHMAGWICPCAAGVESTTLVLNQTTKNVNANGLLTVNSIHKGINSCDSIVSRATYALENLSGLSATHNIIMTDNITQLTVDRHRVIRHNLHLIGDVNHIKFVIIVTSSNNHSDKSIQRKAACDGRYRIDKSLLRSAFVGRNCDNASGVLYGPVRNAEYQFAASELAANTVWIDQKLSPGKPPMKGLGTLSVVPDVDLAATSVETGKLRETLISSSKVARAFFGYKGLPEHDPV